MTRLMSFWTRPTVAAKKAVMAPMTTTTILASGASSNMGDMRATRNTPAVTIVAAWMRAETGVGPSIASGSQVCSRNCADLPMAPMNSSRQRTVEDIELPRQEVEGLARLARSGTEDGVEIDRTEDEEAAEDAEREAEVTHAVDDEGLDGGGVGTLARVPEADEQVGRKAHAFPAEEHLHEVVGRHQHEHGEGEEREIGEEARLVLVVAHVAERIDVNERGNGVHDDQHDGGQRVDPDHPVGRQRAGVDPAQDLDLLGMGLVQEAGEDIPGEHRRHAEQQRGEIHGPCRAIIMAVVAMVVMAMCAMIIVRVGVMHAVDVGVLAETLESLGAEEPGDERAQQRQEDDGGIDGVHDRHQPFMRLMSSTAMVPRLRK